MTAEADTLQATCQHDKCIQTWRFADGAAANMWSCTQCARKFVPLDLAMERDAARYAYIKTNVMRNKLADYLDAAIDAARSAAQKAER